MSLLEVNPRSVCRGNEIRFYINWLSSYKVILVKICKLFEKITSIKLHCFSQTSSQFRTLQYPFQNALIIISVSHTKSWNFYENLSMFSDLVYFENFETNSKNLPVLTISKIFPSPQPERERDETRRGEDDEKKNFLKYSHNRFSMFEDRNPQKSPKQNQTC